MAALQRGIHQLTKGFHSTSGWATDEATMGRMWLSPACNIEQGQEMARGGQGTTGRRSFRVPGLRVPNQGPLGGRDGSSRVTHC